MFSFFKSKPVTPDLSFIGADMHSHLLPGLDDGLKTVEESVAFIGQLAQMGYRKLICTPHIIADIYPNSPATILPKLELVRAALKENNIPVTIEAAAEYMVDLEMEKLVTSGSELLTLGKNLILIEMSYVGASPNMERTIFQLRMRGLQPVLAHPERYVFYHNDFSAYQRLADMGCLMQINLLSLAGYYGKSIKLVAEKLVQRQMVDLLGTDMHHGKHMAALQQLASTKEFYTMFKDVNIRNKALLLKEDE
jgi:tyrosine-protein phosphatase YwqE